MVGTLEAMLRQLNAQSRLFSTMTRNHSFDAYEIPQLAMQGSITKIHARQLNAESKLFSTIFLRLLFNDVIILKNFREGHEVFGER